MSLAPDLILTANKVIGKTSHSARANLELPAREGFRSLDTTPFFPSPALVIRKTFVYGATAALLLFGYAIVESFVVNLVVEVTGISNGFASAVLGALFGLAFHPIKNRMEHLLRPAEVRDISTS